jgi:hypothetical protein
LAIINARAQRTQVDAGAHGALYAAVAQAHPVHTRM